MGRLGVRGKEPRPSPPLVIAASRPSAEMDRFELSDSLVLDARRAAWFPRERVLAVADAHLGYAWAQRRRGLLLPLAATEEVVATLAALQHDYAPREIVFLGDLVHEAANLPALKEELVNLTTRLAAGSRLTVTLGNHDRRLEQFAAEWKLPLALASSATVGGHWLVHGDQPPAAAALATWQTQRVPGARIVFGHEHPALRLGDGVASAARCPCFLIGEDRLVLPAFSPWAAGSVVGRQPFLAPLAQAAVWQQVVAILGGRLLPLPLGALA